MSMINMGTPAAYNGLWVYTTVNKFTTSGGATDESILIHGNGTIGVSTAAAITTDFLRCNLHIENPIPASAWYNISEVSLSYNADNNNRYATASSINFDECSIVFDAPSIKAIFLSDCINTRVFNAGSTLLTYTQGGANLNGMHLVNTNWEVNGQPLEAANIILVNCAITNYLVPRLDFSYIDLTNSGTNLTMNVGSDGLGNISVYMWNIVQFDNTAINHIHVNNKYFDGISASWLFKDRDTGLDVEDVLIINSSDKSGSMVEKGRWTTNSDGLAVGTYDSRFETTGTSQVRDALFLFKNYSKIPGTTHGGTNAYDIIPVVNRVEVRAYGYELPVGYIIGDATALTTAQGTLNPDYTTDTSQIFILNNDLNITQSNKTTVLAYTDLGGNSDKAYDRQKAYWRDTDNVAVIGKSGSQLVPGNIDLVFNKTAASVYVATSTTQTYKMTTDYTGGMLATGTGDLTTQNGVTLNGGVFSGNINYESSAGTTITDITCTGTIDFDTAGTYYIDGCTLNIVTNSSGGAVILILANGATITTNTGPSITINDVKDISITGLVALTRLQIYNVTAASEFYNDVPGTSLITTYNEGGAFTTGDTVRIRAAYQVGASAKKGFETTVIASSSGFSALISQVDHAIYNSYGGDGSGMVEFSWDAPNLEIDITDVDNTTVIQRVGAWYSYFIQTATGIEDLFGAIIWDKLNEIQICTACVDMKVSNTKATPLLITGGRLFRDDGTTIIDATSNAIHLDYDPVYVKEDWTSTERAQMRDAVGMDGNKITATGGQLQVIDTNIDSIKSIVDTNLDATVSSRSTFDHTVNDVTTDTPSREASKADVLGIETKAQADARQAIVVANQEIINTGVQEASVFSPHDTNL